jgi:glycerophosphoryl diester phosphodiesterase
LRCFAVSFGAPLFSHSSLRVIGSHPLLDLSLRPIVGHRGNCAHAPENTLESFRQAISLGVDALEFDVRLTRDGEVVVIHDPTVERTTSGRGAIAALTLAELRELDAGAKFTKDGGQSFPYRGRGIGISTLTELLEETKDFPLLIELKVAEVGAPARRVIERLGAEPRCIVASSIRAAVVPFEGSAIAIGSSPSHIAPMLIPALLGRRYRTLPFRSMSLPEVWNGIPVPLGALARAARPAGVTLHVWTINSPADAKRLWSEGVHGIISDDPRVMLVARDA